MTEEYENNPTRILRKMAQWHHAYLEWENENEQHPLRERAFLQFIRSRDSELAEHIDVKLCEACLANPIIFQEVTILSVANKNELARAMELMTSYYAFCEQGNFKGDDEQKAAAFQAFFQKNHEATNGAISLEEAQHAIKMKQEVDKKFKKEVRQHIGIAIALAAYLGCMYLATRSSKEAIPPVAPSIKKLQTAPSQPWKEKVLKDPTNINQHSPNP